MEGVGNMSGIDDVKTLGMLGRGGYLGLCFSPLRRLSAAMGLCRNRRRVCSAFFGYSILRA